MRKNPFISLAVIALLAACATPQTAKIPDTMAVRDAEPAAEDAAAGKAGPGDQEAGQAAAPLYSLSVRKADLCDTLQLLSRKTGVSIICDRDVDARVTVNFKDRTADEILHALVTPQGYLARKENGVIRVGKPKLTARTFYVNYLKDKRESSSTTNAAETQSSGIAAAAGQTSNKGVTVKTSGVSQFWPEIVKGIETLIFGDSTGGKTTEGGYSRGDKTGRMLVINEMAGVVYVRDYPGNLENIEMFLDEIEKAVKRQVLIQAHIAEVSLGDAYSLGIDWNSILSSRLIGRTLQPMTVSQNLAPTPPTNVFQINVTNSRVTALLDAMKEVGNVNMISSPKVATLNNQKAVIKLITKEVSWFTKTIVTGGNPPVTFSDNLPQIDEVGVYLDVTPQINENGVITMQIHPSISQKTGVSISPDGKSSTPVIDVREVDSMVDVRNNQTIVIAGLIVDKIIETRRSVPLLGDIPYLGWLFSFVSQEKKKTELVILITPYVLDDRKIAAIRDEHEQRLNAAGRKFFPAP